MYACFSLDSLLPFLDRGRSWEKGKVREGASGQTTSSLLKLQSSSAQVNFGTDLQQEYVCVLEFSSGWSLLEKVM